MRGSENSVDEGGDGAPLGEDDKAAENDHHDHDGQKPELLANPHEGPKFFNE